MKKVVEIPKILAKFSIEDAKFHPKRPYRLHTSPRKKGRKKHTKNISPVFSQKKPFFRESPVFLAALFESVGSGPNWSSCPPIALGVVNSQIFRPGEAWDPPPPPKKERKGRKERRERGAANAGSALAGPAYVGKRALSYEHHYW
jgi:hypothetical protein